MHMDLMGGFGWIATHGECVKAGRKQPKGYVHKFKGGREEEEFIAGNFSGMSHDRIQRKCFVLLGVKP